MFLLEIENHFTKNAVIVQAKNKEQAHEKLTGLGYECLSYGELYAGIDDKGDELSVMPAHIPHVAGVKKVNQNKGE